MKRRLLFTCSVLLALVGPAAAEGGRSLPRPTQLQWIDASIRAVQQNGVARRAARLHGIERPDGTLTVPVKHVVRCETAAICTRVSHWAQNAGFVPSSIRTAYLHGGIARFDVDLTRHVPLDAQRIQADALRIHESLSRLAGSRYESWMLDVDPDRSRHAR